MIPLIANMWISITAYNPTIIYSTVDYRTPSSYEHTHIKYDDTRLMTTAF